MDYNNWIEDLEKELNSADRDKYEVELSLTLLTGANRDIHKLILTGVGTQGEPKELSFDIDCNMHVSVFNIINTLVAQLEADQRKKNK